MCSQQVNFSSLSPFDVIQEQFGLTLFPGSDRSSLSTILSNEYDILGQKRWYCWSSNHSLLYYWSIFDWQGVSKTKIEKSAATINHKSQSFAAESLEDDGDDCCDCFYLSRLSHVDISRLSIFHSTAKRWSIDSDVICHLPHSPVPVGPGWWHQPRGPKIQNFTPDRRRMFQFGIRGKEKRCEKRWVGLLLLSFVCCFRRYRKSYSVGFVKMCIRVYECVYSNIKYISSWWLFTLFISVIQWNTSVNICSSIRFIELIKLTHL